jgi:hypothetical protein
MSLYQDTDEAQRAAARRKVSQAAHEGRAPSAYWSAEEIGWAFDGHEETLAGLERIAEQKMEAQRERELQTARRRDVADTAERLLRQWDEDERREKRARAFAEAERLVAEREAAEEA